LRQAGLAVRVIGCKVVQSLSGDDVHRREDVTRPCGWESRSGVKRSWRCPLIRRYGRS
jgi:hypothetical protein